MKEKLWSAIIIICLSFCSIMFIFEIWELQEKVENLQTENMTLKKECIKQSRQFEFQKSRIVKLNLRRK